VRKQHIAGTIRHERGCESLFGERRKFVHCESNLPSCPSRLVSTAPWHAIETHQACRRATGVACTLRLISIEAATMRMKITMGFAVLVLSAIAVPASGAPCPIGTVQVCPPPNKMRPPAGDQCRCVTTPGGPTGGGGRAEIHKKNVPTVKPDKSPGPND
jgi:hypothetical protein